MEALNTFKAEEQPTDSPEYVAEMVAKAEGAAKPPADEVPKVEDAELPEKFKGKSAAEIAKAYAELEKKLGEGKPKEEPKEEQPKKVEGDQSEAAKELLESKGLNFDSFAQEFAENGTLSDETYDALEKAGIPSSLVDRYIDGQLALASQVRQEAFSVVGGEKQYTEMVNWAKDNLDPSEINAFNRSIDSDLAQAKLAIQGLAARYRSEVGKTPNLVQGQTSGSSAGVFRSTAELMQAMSDPRYQSDPAYRQDVAAKLSRSNVL